VQGRAVRDPRPSRPLQFPKVMYALMANRSTIIRGKGRPNQTYQEGLTWARRVQDLTVKMLRLYHLESYRHLAHLTVLQI
jgi:hypothetical protein